VLSRLAVIAIATAMILGCGGGTGVDEYSVEYGSPAPPYAGTLLTDEHVSSESLLGKPVILTFWASTCVPCKQELPVLAQLATEHADDDLTVLAINTGESESAIEAFFKEIGVDLPVVIDQNGEIVVRYEVLLLPMTFFIDREGTLQYKTLGEPKSKQIDHGVAAILGVAI